MQDPALGSDRSIAGQIARALAERIVVGEIAPGARLLQDHVAEEFQASHVPVREAFRRLEAQGLVVSEPRRGVRVPGLDPAVITEVTEMRAALETLALRHALPKITEADLAEAERAADDSEASDDIRVWEEANRRFHRVTVQPCGMPRLLRFIDDLHATSARFLFATWREMDWEARSEAEHRELLAALRAKDEARALEILRQHILAAGEALRAGVEQGVVDPDGGA